jgi:dihydrodipicolinate synthase/N-acetylneuraminate lyase
MTYRKNIEGIILPVPSFYKNNLNLDFEKLRKFLKFQIERNIKNFYLASTASEFEFMSESERIKTTKFVSSNIDKNTYLLSQPIGSGSFLSQANEGLKMIEAGASALVIKPQSVKETANFFGSKYALRQYSPNRHDDFFINYINKISNILKCPIFFHDQPFANGIGLSSDAIKEILKNKFIIGFKLHTQDLNHLKNQYKILGSKVCFDGFGKTTQFWTIQWGAKAMHSCWSWFEPEVDLKFFHSMKKNQLKKALEIINRETPIIDAIRKSGFPGYKELMRLSGLPYTKSRIPGENLNKVNKEIIHKAYRKIKKIRVN